MNTELLTLLEGLAAKLSPNDALVGSLLFALMVLMTLFGMVKALLQFVRKTLALICTSAVQMWHGYDTTASDDDDSPHVFSDAQIDQFATLLDSRMDRVEFALCPDDVTAIKMATAELLQEKGFHRDGNPSAKPDSTSHDNG